MQYRFLIYISYSYALPIGKPLEQEVLGRGHSVFWFSDEDNGVQALRQKDFVKQNINEVIAYDPHIIITISDSVPDFLKGLKVQIFHGFNAEKRSFRKDHFRIRSLFDLYCTQGPSTTSIFKEQSVKYGTFEVVETGWSKVDPLFTIESEINETIPTVFIASTFTPRLSLAYNDDVYLEIERLSKTNEFKFLMTLHPKIPDTTKARWLLLENENFQFFNTTDIIPLMRKADIMFSDTTSAIQEFGLQAKLTVTFKHYIPKPFYINVEEASMIAPALREALLQPEKIHKALRAFNAQLHPYTDGKSSGRVIDACISFLHADKSYLKPKPLNLVRKFKIRQKLDHYTTQTTSRPSTVQKTEGREKITAIIPAGNEIHNIEEVIASVSFADEILVVDSMSTDGTYDKALELKTSVIRRKYQYSASQKNWAIPQAKHEWIILVDADERVTPELKEEILAVLNNPPTDGTVAYWIYRMNHFMGKRVKYSGWQNDKVIRLFKRDHCVYEDKMVHAEIIADGKVAFLKNKFYHDTYISIDHHVKKLNRYAAWQARDYDKRTNILTAYHFALKPFWSFFKHYIIQMGFRDGVVGFVISSLHAYAVMMRYAKLWLHRRGRL